MVSLSTLSTSLMIVFFLVLITYQVHLLMKMKMIEGMTSSSLNGTTYYSFSQPNNAIQYPPSSSSPTTLTAEQTTEAISQLMNNSTFLYNNLPGLQTAVQDLSTEYQSLSQQVTALSQTTGDNAKAVTGGQPLPDMTSDE